MLNDAIRSAVVLLLMLPPTANAQSWAAKALKKRDIAPAAPKNSGSSMKPCPEYGAGFYRLDSGTCVRIGGGVEVGAGASSARR